MAQQLINVGTAPNIENGEPVRDGFEKAISNVEELLESQGIQVDTFDLPNIGISPNDHTGDLITIGFEKLQFQQEVLNDYQDYDKRITTDLGVVDDNQFTLDYLKFLKQQGTLENTKLLIAPEMGTKRRVSGVNTYVSKAYSAQLPTNDATQSTELSQLWLSGNIAPNEKLALKNPNGGSRFLTHPAISFAANEAWSVNMSINASKNDYVNLFGTSISTSAGSMIRLGSLSNLISGYFDNDVGMVIPSQINIAKHYGKTIIFTCVSDTTKLLFYINGLYVGSTSNISAFTMNVFMSGRSNFAAAGKAYSHRIQSGTLTPEQVTAEYNFLRARFPEIESVQIGTQTWATSNFEAVATPQGNVIPEMQTNAGVHRIQQPLDLFTFTIWNTGITNRTQSSFTTNGTGGLHLASFNLIVGKWYRLRAIGTATAAHRAETFGFGSRIYTAIAGGNFSYDIYFKAAQATSILFATSVANTITYSELSVQELGWVNSTEIYDAVYAATSGTVEQKTYAAVKEAAMWCHYNNSPDLGAIYGKLYNWYAVKLLQMDIDYYNAANPTTPWGWRVPTEADFNTLVATLGGASIAGGKMKVAGTSYWNSPNTGADNSSGFSAIGSGWRNNTDGLFNNLLQLCRQWTISEVDTLTSKMAVVTYNDSTLIVITATFKARGLLLRLIKTT